MAQAGSERPLVSLPDSQGGTQDPLSVIAAGGKPGVGVGQETDRGGHRGTTPPPGQFLLLGVPDGHFQHQLWGELEKLGVIAVGLEQERQDIEAASRGFPALLNTDLGTEFPRHISAPAPPNTAGTRAEASSAGSLGYERS